MKLHIEIDEKELKTMIFDHIQSALGDIHLDESQVRILVKSKQNYKSEWEAAQFKADYTSPDYQINDN